MLYVILYMHTSGVKVQHLPLDQDQTICQPRQEVEAQENQPRLVIYKATLVMYQLKSIEEFQM